MAPKPPIFKYKLEVERTPTLTIAETIGTTLEDLAEGVRFTRFIEEPPEGYICHFSAAVPVGTIGCGIWTDRSLADHWLATKVIDAFGDFVLKARDSHDRPPDFTYAMAPTFALTFGEAIHDYVGRGMGEADGAQMFCFSAPLEEAAEYRTMLEHVGFDIEAPPGFVFRIAAPFSRTWRSFIVFRDGSSARDFFGSITERIDHPDVDSAMLNHQRATIVPLNSLFVPEPNAPELDDYRAAPERWDNLELERGTTDVWFDVDSPNELSDIARLLRS